MAAEAAAEQTLAAFVAEESQKDLLRFTTCGSVDDGKSTLLGRLLYESRQVFTDQLVALAADSKTSGTRGGALDFALLVDGLSAEREQGITIDVAYRYFSTHRRKFIVADTPGHEQYTRNMVTGASQADLALVLVDATRGIRVQTRRHTHLLSLLGVRSIVLVVNKMDLVGFQQERFRAIADDYAAFANRAGLHDIASIPVSATEGDNIAGRSESTPWYDGPPLLELLETVQVAKAPGAEAFRMPVQLVNRPDSSFRGYAGMITSGRVSAGDEISVLPSGRTSRVERIVAFETDQPSAIAGQCVTLTLSDDIAISRGDVLVGSGRPAEVADRFDATLVWMHADPMLPGREYSMKLGPKTVMATIAPLKHKIDPNTLDPQPAEVLQLNEIGACELSLSTPIAFAPYAQDRALGGFILIDRITRATVGAGMIGAALRRPKHVHWHGHTVGKHDRALIKGQQPCIIWLTGLSGAGKSTIANLVEQRLAALGRHTYLLDGDNVRHGINRDLGFTDADRVENIRRVAEVARLMVDAGLIVLVAFISPFRAERRMARGLVAPSEFVEVFVDVPFAVAESRDPKGLYKRARRGELVNFTGLDSPYEAPEQPELRIDTATVSEGDAADSILEWLVNHGVLPRSG